MTIYYAYPDGRFGSVQTSGDEDPPVPEGAVRISHEDYLARVAQMEEEQRQREAEQQAADEARQLADYLALRAAGFPHDLAARLSGYKGPERTE